MLKFTKVYKSLQKHQCLPAVLAFKLRIQIVFKMQAAYIHVFACVQVLPEKNRLISEAQRTLHYVVYMLPELAPWYRSDLSATQSPMAPHLTPPDGQVTKQ